MPEQSQNAPTGLPPALLRARTSIISAMSFAAKVAALRDFFGVPPTVALPVAVARMTSAMQLDETAALPVQVVRWGHGRRRCVSPPVSYDSQWGLRAQCTISYQELRKVSAAFLLVTIS